MTIKRFICAYVKIIRLKSRQKGRLRFFLYVQYLKIVVVILNLTKSTVLIINMKSFSFVDS